ncbi:MAG: MarR family transcriptional regulator [Candidatus Methanofastidiosia archaeon]
METDTEMQILDYLKKQEMGATVTDIASELGMSRTTTVKYLEVMRATGLLDYKEVGMAKLWYVSTKLSYAQHVLLVRTKQLVEAIETPDEHLQILDRSIQPHVEIIQTYSESDRKKFSKLFSELSEKIKS